MKISCILTVIMLVSQCIASAKAYRLKTSGLLTRRALQKAPLHQSASFGTKVKGTKSDGTEAASKGVKAPGKTVETLITPRSVDYSAWYVFAHIRNLRPS